MGKRSTFERIPRDFYPTPQRAVPPLIPHLRGVRSFAEPCCGDGALVRHLESLGLRCAYAGDIATGQDALAARPTTAPLDAIITNPPYTRPLMHALIAHFQRIAPTWLLLELDWAATKQAIPYLTNCSDIVTIGRLRWIPGIHTPAKKTMVGTVSTCAIKANRSFIRKGRHRQHPAAAVRNVVRPTNHRVRTRGSVLMPADNVPIASD